MTSSSCARLLSAMGAYVCLAAQFGGLAHAVLVRHATCPSHGEVIHTSSGRAHAPALPTTRSSVAPAPVATEEGDEHCLALATRKRDLAGLAPGVTAVVAEPAASAPLVTQESRALRALPLLRLAPKTSPPVAV